MRKLEEVIRDACDVFSSVRFPYVIVGGVAVNLLGRARSTFDIDVIAEIQHRIVIIPGNDITSSPTRCLPAASVRYY